MHAAPIHAGSELPAVPGAYVLLIATAKPVELAIGGKLARLPPGNYLYCGSAKGPGGIRTRVGRHLKAGKTLRWHVDRLAAAGTIEGVIVAPDGNECDLFDRLHTTAGSTIPVTGFGSSDCRRWPAHLLRIGGSDKAIELIRPHPHETFVRPELPRFIQVPDRQFDPTVAAIEQRRN